MRIEPAQPFHHVHIAESYAETLIKQNSLKRPLFLYKPVKSFTLVQPEPVVEVKTL